MKEFFNEKLHLKWYSKNVFSGKSFALNLMINKFTKCFMSKKLISLDQVLKKEEQYWVLYSKSDDEIQFGELTASYRRLIIQKLKRCFSIFRYTDLRKNLISLIMLFCFNQSSSKLHQKLGLEKRTNQIMYILCLFWVFVIPAVPHKKSIQE